MLNKIMWVNFHKMNLPNIDIHTDLNAIKQAIDIRKGQE